MGPRMSPKTMGTTLYLYSFRDKSGKGYEKGRRFHSVTKYAKELSELSSGEDLEIDSRFYYIVRIINIGLLNIQDPSEEYSAYVDNAMDRISKEIVKLLLLYDVRTTVWLSTEVLFDAWRVFAQEILTSRDMFLDMELPEE